ncbi:MAG: LCP family protein [Marmoricola sp.]
MNDAGDRGGPVAPPPAEVPPLPEGTRPPRIDDTERARLDWEHPDYQGVRRRRRRPPAPTHHWYRPRNTVLIPLVVLVLLLGGFVVYLDAQLAGIRRSPLLPAFDGPAGVGINVLLVGSEAPADSLAVDGSTMVVQLVHLSADRSLATVVNVPRDLLLHPAGDQRSETPAQAYARGGEPVLVGLVGATLDVRVDHVVQVGFDAYRRVTDRLGGVDMPTAEGERHFDGEQALRYADEPDVSGGTVETGHRHQQWLKAMLAAAVRPAVLLDPLVVVGLLRDTTPRMVVDDTFTTADMRGLLWSSRGLDPGSIHYLTTPTGRHRRVAGRTVLLPDPPALAQLAQALHADDQATLATFLG